MSAKYTNDHEWVRMEGDVAVIGITPHAAEQLGDVVFVDLPETGRIIKQHADMAVVESVKAASDVYAPISGEIIEANQLIVNDPSKVNEDPMGLAWFVKIKPSNSEEFDTLMDEEEYKEYTENL